MIKDLSREKSFELIRRGRLARLGCISDGEPYIVPVNYILDGENILVHSLPGRKIQAMRANPRVCFQIDEIEDELSWKSVLVYGRYEEINQGAERARVLNNILSSFPNLTPVETTMAFDAGTPKPLAFRICIDSVTGISEGV